MLGLANPRFCKMFSTDLEKGLNGSEDGTVDVKDEIEEGYAKKM